MAAPKMRIPARMGATGSFILHSLAHNIQTYEDLFAYHQSVVGGQSLSEGIKLEVKVGFSPESSVLTSVPATDDISTEFGKFVTFHTESLVKHPKENPLSAMMAASRELRPLQKLNVTRNTDNRTKLYNAVVDMLTQNGGKWTVGAIGQGELFAKLLTSIMWKIDPHIKSRHLSMPAIFSGLQGFNDPKRHGHVAKPLDQTTISEFTQTLALYMEKPWMAKDHWNILRTATDQLLEELNRLLVMMINDQQRQRKNREAHQPLATDSWSLLCLANDGEYNWVDNPTITAIKERFISKDMYEWENINELIPTDAVVRHRFIDKLGKNGLLIKAGCKLILYTHAYGNNTETIRFAWLIPSNAEECDEDKHRSVQRACEKSVPVYHSRYLKRRFTEMAESMNMQDSAKVRKLYSCATGDASASRTSDERGVDERLLQFIELADESIIYDLRALNHKSSHFEEFFNAAERIINEEIETSVDDRRQDTIVHLARAVSAADLYNRVKEVAPDVPAPSLEWFRLQFWPKHSNRKTAKLYTGRLKVKHMVQQRQLRVTHPDTHFCNAIYRYIKEFVVKFREFTTMFSLDDKCKVCVGEPNTPIAAVSRGRRVLVGVDETFQVADHDFSRGSIIPSVSLRIDIPQKATESFYKGSVYVALKDAVFQPSNPYRHAVELAGILNADDEVPPILALYTDGGPDHRCNFLSVMYSMVYLYMRLNLDYVVLARNAPGHSWRNPAERVMSVLNLGLQAVGVMRSSTDHEAALKKCGSMKALREAAAKNPDLEIAWRDSVQQPVSLINSVFSRLKWGQHNLNVETPASAAEIDAVEEGLQSWFDVTLTKTDSKADLRNRPKIKEFLDQHTYQGKYFFIIKKCNSCEYCSEHRLPTEVYDQLKFIPIPQLRGEHYRPFEEAYPEGVTEIAMPDPQPIRARRVMDIDPQIKATAQNAKTVRRFVNCEECGTPRVIYSNHRLKDDQKMALERALEGLQYTCGTNFRFGVDEEDTTHIFHKVSMRLMECGDPVERAYSSSGIFPEWEQR